ncbi:MULTISPECIES: diadenylate cyclase CdaA [Enterococcaceae]|uniref:Diadenylate cyclase n=1 Tax=Vagococcus luciliae TaxID=2920380 RepID=A0ABY5P067_9ENTE|nr:MULTISPECIES: diadenylate cyclase CdaA [Enterococcaceae]RGI30740.1 TIGR00159 family protein [Melissococcus sp. OM08-11BH]UUV99305.1 Cyclic di-AMP synthase CdaA [Vagococcus luciliae]
MILTGTSLFRPEIWQNLLNKYLTLSVLVHVVDILVVWYVVYKLLMLLNDTKAIQVFKGIAVIIIVRIVSDFLGLNTVSWLMNQVITYGVVAAIVIFQPEVRRGLEHLGRGAALTHSNRQKNMQQSFITALDEALQYMSKRKIGALITIQRNDNLIDIIESGIPLDADISSQLLINIFIPNTPLHDGAVIIKDNKIASASSYLPLSESNKIPKEFGTRHRAAIGVSETSDALTLVVSEETGEVSITHNKTFLPGLQREAYLEVLKQELSDSNEEESQSGIALFIEDVKKSFKKGGKKDEK